MKECQRYCCSGYKLEEVIRGMGSLRVQFVSDDSGTYRGFQATFQDKINKNFFHL